MDLEETFPLYYVVQFAGRITIHVGKAKIAHNPYGDGDDYYEIVEDHGYLGRVGNRLDILDRDVFRDKDKALELAIKRTRRSINNSMNTLAKYLDDVRKFERGQINASTQA